MSTERDYQTAADWAEADMTLTPGSVTALRGTAAADLGRDLLRRATGGRPSIDPAAGPGQHSRTRQVRVAADLDSALDAVAHAQHRRVSDVMRDALTDYIATHRAS